MTTVSYDRHRFPPCIIRHGVWLYLRFSLSLRDVEDLLVERGIEVSYETIRRWVEKFGPAFAAALRARPQPNPLSAEARPGRRYEGRSGSGSLNLNDAKPGVGAIRR
jgi:hypothetical protein